MGRSSFYAFCRRPENQRVRQDRRLVALIRGAFEGAHRVYGSRRIQAELRSQGVWCGRRRPGVGLIHHSDQGVQYACEEFQGLLGRYQLVPSMSRRGDPYGNAVAESFFRTLKVELVYRRHFATHQEARAAIVQYIETFYNCHRRHSSLGYLSPAQYEKQTCLS